MNSIVRNILAVVAGIIAGGVVNMGIIMVGGGIVPPPAGADMTTVEGITAAMPRMEPVHFLVPFLAHALGSFISGLVVALLAASHKMKFAVGLGVLTLIGGIAAAMMIPAPVWFVVLDLAAAYLPTAYIGGLIGRRATADIRYRLHRCINLMDIEMFREISLSLPSATEDIKWGNDLCFSIERQNVFRLRIRASFDADDQSCE